MGVLSIDTIFEFVTTRCTQSLQTYFCPAHHQHMSQFVSFHVLQPLTPNNIECFRSCSFESTCIQMAKLSHWPMLALNLHLSTFAINCPGKFSLLHTYTTLQYVVSPPIILIFTVLCSVCYLRNASVFFSF